MRRFAIAVAAVLAVTGCASTQSVQGGSAQGPTGSAPGTSSSGAGGSTGTAQPTAPAPVSPIDSRCPAKLDEGQHLKPWGKLVPSDVEVAWVLRCTVKPQPDGTRDLLVERSDSSPAALLAALQAPDAPPSKGACPMLGMVVPYFALVQHDGHALVPHIPVTGCRLPQPPVLQALNAMQFKVISQHRMP